MEASSSFPKGLRVLLVDYEDSLAGISASLQSPELGYAVTAVSSSTAALSFLRTGVAAFDVVLAEAKVVAADEAVGRSFVDAFEDTPVVLMAAAAGHADVLRAVKMGAVDFLDKPLSLLKLKNIWQHSVRKMMLKAAGPRGAAGCAHAASASATPSVAPTPTTILPVVAPVAPSTAAMCGWAGASVPAAAPAPSASTGPESPGTPAGSVDLPETFSVCSMDDTSGSVHGSVRASFDAGSAPAPAPSASEGYMDALNGALGGLHRNASYTSMPSPAAAAPLAHGGPAPAVWPALPTGCVWGTPFNGPVPPPLPSAACVPAPASVPAPAPAPSPAPAPVAKPEPKPEPADWTDVVLPAAPEVPTLIKGGGPSAVMQPVPASTDALVLPEGFLTGGPTSGSGPLGLRLRKSPSLLNMINSALSSEPALQEGGMGLAPMVLC